MIEQELILLGLLKESPKHGYEIKKEIREILSLFTGIETKSIYYPLRILKKRGLVTTRIAKSGRRPQRLVYALTPRGESRFKELLTRSLLSFKRPQFSLDVSLYFIRHIQPKILKRRLRARMSVLNKLAISLRQAVVSSRRKQPGSLGHILEHDLEMVQAESRFLLGLIRTL